MMWAGIAGAFLGAALIAWAWIRRASKQGAIEDASEAIGAIEAYEKIRDDAIKGSLEDAKVYDMAMERADAAHKFLEENAEDIKKRSTKETLDILARWGY